MSDEKTERLFDKALTAVKTERTKGAVLKPRRQETGGDQTAADELRLYIDNDGDLYRQQTSPIHKNLVTKMAQGKCDSDLAVKLFMYLVESGAKKYVKEFGGRDDVWHVMFDVPTRRIVARQLRDHFEVEAKLGNYDHLLPKKYQKAHGVSLSRRAGSWHLWQHVAYRPMAKKIAARLKTEGKKSKISKSKEGFIVSIWSRDPRRIGFRE